MKPVAALVAVLLALSGCAASQSRVAASSSMPTGGDAYALALAEAFDAYEREVQTASTLTYSSEAEARAVMQTLSDARFDHELRTALARHGLSASELASYAEAHPEFFHAQQRAYWGRLERLQHTVESLTLHVQPHDDAQMLAVDMSE